MLCGANSYRPNLQELCSSLGLCDFELAYPVAGFSFQKGAGEGKDPFLTESGGAEKSVDVLLGKDHIIIVIRFVSNERLFYQAAAGTHGVAESRHLFGYSFWVPFGYYWGIAQLEGHFWPKKPGLDRKKP